MVPEKLPGVSHADLEPARMKKDEQSTQAVINLLESTWVNLFSTQSELISISTASAAPPDVKHDLTVAREKGEKAYDEFKNHALKRMHLRTPMKDSLNYSLGPLVTSKNQKRRKFEEKIF